MTSLLFQLVNAPPAVQRLAALGLAAALCLGVASTGYIALSVIGQLERDVQDKRELAGRLQAVAALKPALLAQAQAKLLPSDSAEFLAGESVAVVRGSMQAQASAIASAQGANLLSVSNGPEMESHGVRYLGIDIDFSGTVEAVHNTVLALEASQPLIVRSASFWLSGPPQTPGAAQPSELTAQIHVFGALRPDAAPATDKAAP